MAHRAAIFALFLALLTSQVQAAVLAIDYGSDWMKASVPKPGSRGALDVLLNTDSKRKIQSVVAWNKEERLFGTDGFNMAARFPADSFSSLKYLQGSKFGGSNAEFFSEISGVKIVETSRHTVGLQRSDGSEWSTEELIAMQLAYAKDLAEAFAEEPVTDVIMTVPPFYSQFERQAVIDAIEIAGMKPLSLVSDGLAVAINYAMARSFPEKENHIVYDAGSSSITASVVSFFNSKVADPTKVLKSSLKNSTAIHVKGIGYDTVASGTELDRRLRNVLVQMFEKQTGKPVKDNSRAMARLWKEAGRVKSVLSANTDSSIAVESLAHDKDFKSSISRATFEKLASDLKPRYAQPILDALAAANMTMADIKSVILTGGASRIPMIRNAVKNTVGEPKIALNVNADEAAVLGAAFYGATLSGRFHSAKRLDVRDIAPYDITLSYSTDKKPDAVFGGKPRVINSQVYAAGSKMGGSAKAIKFPNKNDFTVIAKYKNPGTLDFPQEIFEAKITGLTEAIANLTRDGVTAPFVRVDALLNESGMLTLSNPIARGEAPKPKEGLFDKMRNLVVGENTDSASDSTSTTSTSTSSGSSSTTDATSTTSSTAPKETNTMRTLTIPLNMEITHLSIPPVNSEEKALSRGRLAAIRVAEAAVRRHSEALNQLEGYLYRLRDLLEGANDTPFMEFSKPEERETLQQKSAETLEWFNEEAENAEASEIWKRRDELELIESTVINRYKEASTGPKSLQNLQKALYLGRTFLKVANENRTAEIEAGEPQRFTDDELAKLTTMLDEDEAWLKEKIAAQKILNKRDDAVLKTVDMDARGVKVQKLVSVLNKKKFPKKVAAKTTSTVPTPTPSASAEDASSTDKVEEEVPLTKHEKDEL